MFLLPFYGLPTGSTSVYNVDTTSKKFWPLFDMPRSQLRQITDFMSKRSSHAPYSRLYIGYTKVQVILFEIDCAFFYTNLHKLFR